VFEADFKIGELRKNGLRIKVQDQPFQVLAMLLEKPGGIVTREELQRRLWPADTFVDFDHSLNSAIKKLREALGDQAENPRFIETLHRRGYRFIAPVDGNGTSAASASVESALIKKAGAKPRPTRGPRVGIALGLGVAVLLLTLLGFAFEYLLSTKNATPQIRSLAVLPLQNLSADREQEYFSDGLTDALITDLAQIRSLEVISRTSSMQYKGTKKSMAEVARELKVDGVVEGTVQRSGDRVRITAQLIDATNDRHLWAQSFERSPSDVIQLQDDIAQSISAAIATVAQPERARLHRKRPVDQEAYDNYLKGRYELNKRERVALARARDFFDRATVKDPDFGEGYAGLASCYLILGEYEVLPPAEAYPKARDAAARALQIDETLAEAHLVLAGVKRDYDWDFPAAEDEFRRGIDLSPSSATAHQWYAEMLSEDLGRHADAIAEIESAQRLDSLSPIINTIHGDVLRLAGRTDEARLQLEHTLAMDPQFAYAHAILGNVYLHDNLIGKAAEEYKRATVMSPNSPWYMSMLAFCYGRVGRRAEAEKLLQALLAQSQNGYVPSVDIAASYEAVGQEREALTYLQKAYDERDVKLRWLDTKPNFENLHSNQKFQELLRRISSARGKAPPPPGASQGPL
jgi:TolB-like protein/DNA-binding winged helix-turn-helix (wHTH) protein/Flp pilus assembly protein TadD